MILIYITCKDEAEAENISKTLIGKKLAKCTNIFPIKSFYIWKNKFTKDSEVVLIAKTKKELFKKLESEVKKIHSYEVPCILSIDVNDVNKEYKKWVEEL